MVASETRQGQEALAAGVILLVGVIFIGIHAMHLRLIDRSIS